MIQSRPRGTCRTDKCQGPLTYADTSRKNLLDFDLSGCRIALARSTAANGDDGSICRCAGRIRHKIHQRHFRGHTVLENGIHGGILVLRDISHLRQVVRTQRLGHDKRRVVNGSDRPLSAIFGLIGWRWRERIVVSVLTTDVEHRQRKAVNRHCHCPVDAPERGSKRIGYSRKTGTRSSVSLEHHEWLPVLASKSRRIDVLLYKAGGCVVYQKAWEDVLWVSWSSEGGI